MNRRSVRLALKVRYPALAAFLEDCVFERAPGEIWVQPDHPLALGDRVLVRVDFAAGPDALTIEGVVEERTAAGWRVRFACMALDQQRRLARLCEAAAPGPGPAKILVLQSDPRALTSRIQLQEIGDWLELQGWRDDALDVIDSVDAWCAALDGRTPWTTVVDLDALSSLEIAQILSRVRDTASSTGIVTSTRAVAPAAPTVRFLAKPLHYGRLHQALTAIPPPSAVSA